jgi:hypothetical protein
VRHTFLSNKNPNNGPHHNRLARLQFEKPKVPALPPPPKFDKPRPDLGTRIESLMREMGIEEEVEVRHARTPVSHAPVYGTKSF